MFCRRLIFGDGIFEAHAIKPNAFSLTCGGCLVLRLREVRLSRVSADFGHDLGDDLFNLRGHHGAGVLHGGDGLVVTASHEVSADAGHVFEHLDAVLEVAHAAALVVTPGDGDFANDVLQLASDEENLGIEAPALDGLKTEDDLRCLAFEGLEAALGVFEG